MESIIAQLLDRYREDAAIISISIVKNPAPFNPLLEGIDLLVLVIEEGEGRTSSISHYIKEPYRIQERRLSPAQVEMWIVNGSNRSIIHWILQGEVLMDRNSYLEGLKHTLLECPPLLRQKKLFIEFAHFLRSYHQAKQHMQDGHLLDAYSNILEALCHWARIAIIEEGYQPELIMWAQLRKINPGVYKLYEELTSNNETMEQRVKLVLLACEFSAASKMEDCCTILLDILRSRKEAWSVNELMNLPQLKELDVDLSLLLSKLVRKLLVKEVAVSQDDSLLLELRYTV